MSIGILNTVPKDSYVQLRFRTTGLEWRFKAFLLNQQHQNHLGTSEQCIFLDPTSDVLNAQLRGRGPAVCGSQDL